MNYDQAINKLSSTTSLDVVLLVVVVYIVYINNNF